jgi:hypothetical protein
MNVITDFLDLFADVSGLMVSKEKTQFYTSPNVTTTEIKELERLSTFQHTKDLGKYLGVPLLHGGTTKLTYQYIIEKTQRRLNGWKANNLSLAGRITLSKAVLNTLAVYSMQSAVLPMSISKKLDALIRN